MTLVFIIVFLLNYIPNNLTLILLKCFSLFLVNQSNNHFKQMCCNLRRHVIVIAILSIAISGLGGTHWALDYTGLQPITTIKLDVYKDNFGDYAWVEFLLFATCLFADICCLIGAIKRNKHLLIPFIIISFGAIVLLSGCALLLLIFGMLGEISEDLDKNLSDKDEDQTFLFLILIPLSIVLSLNIYFVIIVLRFYKAISSGATSIQETGMCLRPLNTAQNPQGKRTSNHYV